MSVFVSASWAMRYAASSTPGVSGLGLAVDDEVRGQAGPAELLAECGQVRQARLGREREDRLAVLSVFDDADEPTEVGECLAADLLHDQERRAGAVGVAVELQPCGSALDGHDGHAVGDHVVQVAGDAGAFGGHGGVCALLPLALDPVGALLEVGGCVRVRPRRAKAPSGSADGDQRPDEQAEPEIAGPDNAAVAAAGDR